MQQFLKAFNICLLTVLQIEKVQRTKLHKLNINRNVGPNGFFEEMHFVIPVFRFSCEQTENLLKLLYCWVLQFIVNYAYTDKNIYSGPLRHSKLGCSLIVYANCCKCEDINDYISSCLKKGDRNMKSVAMPASNWKPDYINHSC